MHSPHFPCVRCGYCCRTQPCPVGEMGQDGCLLLAEGNRCKAYEWILANEERMPILKIAPGFGRGCGAPDNPARQAILAALEEEAGA